MNNKLFAVVGVTIIVLFLLVWGVTSLERPNRKATLVIEKTPHTNEGCLIHVIVKIEGDTTYMDVEGTEPKARIARQGNWGTPGERIRYCE